MNNKIWKALYELLEIFNEIDEENKKDSLIFNFDKVFLGIFIF